MIKKLLCSVFGHDWGEPEELELYNNTSFYRIAYQRTCIRCDLWCQIGNSVEYLDFYPLEIHKKYFKKHLSGKIRWPGSNEKEILMKIDRNMLDG